MRLSTVDRTRMKDFFRGTAIFFACLLLTTLASMKAFALPIFLDTAKVAYSFKAGGKLDSAKCNLCHSGVTNATHLNPYGKDVQGVLKSGAGKELTATSLRSLDETDSDGDGFSNGYEFKSDTLPGDSASKPAGLPPSKTKPAQVQQSENAFSVQSTLLARNAQHPAIVHFPIALFLFSLFLDAIGSLRKNASLNSAAYLNLIAATVTSWLSIATGLLAWQIKLRGTPLEGGLRLHLILAIVTSVSLCVLWVVRHKTKTSDRPFAKLYWALAAIAAILVALTGHLGGIISGVAG